MKAIDSSTLVKLFSKEEGWEKVGEVIREGAVTLDLTIKEVANALWKKVLRGEMSEDVSVKILSDLVKGEAIKIISQEEYLIDAFRIAIEEKITVYDALFISLAKTKGIELVTCDRKQYEAAVKEGLNASLLV
ncbi:type II toxin-antitoxin system VapC family toxin [Sulfuracidifex tepidarius]|uniref:Ribonuclease VapC3 n=2 Tax=Sulfuracidifex tepidarius TaxID=1294262 RepID=A0A510E5S0_9CREN|nr:type II toxin-antitoxin system VapC family toxin [Sulfuracidifex tepidarius]BBG27882.1 Ribonuclease VapC3 [Sulfuracidifex tepidarius]